MKKPLGTSELLQNVFGSAPIQAPTIPEPAPVPPPEPEKKNKPLSPFVALQAQKTYQNPMDTQTGKAPGPVQGGTADALGTGGAWGQPG